MHLGLSILTLWLHMHNWLFYTLITHLAFFHWDTIYCKQTWFFHPDTSTVHIISTLKHLTHTCFFTLTSPIHSWLFPPWHPAVHTISTLSLYCTHTCFCYSDTLYTFTYTWLYSPCHLCCTPNFHPDTLYTHFLATLILHILATLTPCKHTVLYPLWHPVYKQRHSYFFLSSGFFHSFIFFHSILGFPLYLPEPVNPSPYMAPTPLQ